MTRSTLDCPKEYSDVNEENTPCLRCGSRKHYVTFLGYIRCSWCDTVIDEMIPNLVGDFRY